VRSIRQRLLITLLSIIALVGIVTLARSYLDARHEVQELFDAQLAQSARVLQSLVFHEIAEGDLGPESEDDLERPRRRQLRKRLEREESRLDEHHGHGYELKVAFQVWRADGQLLMHSMSTPEQPLAPEVFDRTNYRGGFADATIDGDHWRVFSLWDADHRFLIQVGERHDVRDELTTKISRRLVTPSVISLPILGLLIWFGIGGGLAPLRKVAAEVTRRAPTYLEPVDVGPVPREVRPLVDNLNDLFARLASAFDRERRFTADAAHELRTPLSALKTQAQVALRASDDAERRAALEQLLAGVDRASHLIDQLLTLARLEPGAHPIQRQSLQLRPILVDVLSQLGGKAVAKDLNLELTGEADPTVAGEPVSLSMLVRNLVDNAIRYTPSGGMVTVAIDEDAKSGVVELTVTDTGPGIEPALRERVFDPFYRGLGSGTPGCGLGLAIVRQIAELHDARVELDDNPAGSGLRVRVIFPRPATK